MTFTGLDLLFLEINSLEESVGFYQQKLGFLLETHTPESEPPMATFRAGKLKLTLVQQLETMLRRGRGCHFFVGVSDVDAYHGQLKQRGLITGPPLDEGWGGRFITLEDPDKYRFFFVTWTDEQPAKETG